jgi:hypothetical protein
MQIKELLRCIGENTFTATDRCSHYRATGKARRQQEKRDSALTNSGHSALPLCP